MESPRSNTFVIINKNGLYYQKNQKLKSRKKDTQFLEVPLYLTYNEYFLGN